MTEEQRVADVADAKKDRKDLSIQININTVLTSVVGAIMVFVGSKASQTYDTVRDLNQQLPALVERVKFDEDQIKSLWQYASRERDLHQVPTQDQ
jgi:hypothetical protein